MGKKLLLRAVTAVLLLGLAAALAYVGAYGYTTWRTDARTDEMAARAAQRRSNTTPAPSPAAGERWVTPSLPDAGNPAEEETKPSAQAPAVSPAAMPRESAETAEALCLFPQQRPLRMRCWRITARSRGKTRTWQGGSALRTRRWIIP